MESAHPCATCAAPKHLCSEPRARSPSRVSRALITDCLETSEDVVMTSRPSSFQRQPKEDTLGGMQEAGLAGAAQAWSRTVTKCEGRRLRQPLPRDFSVGERSTSRRCWRAGLPQWSSGEESALQCKAWEFDPCWRAKTPHASEQLRPCTATTASLSRYKRSCTTQPRSRVPQPRPNTAK